MNTCKDCGYFYYAFAAKGHDRHGYCQHDCSFIRDNKACDHFISSKLYLDKFCRDCYHWKLGGWCANLYPCHPRRVGVNNPRVETEADMHAPKECFQEMGPKTRSIRDEIRQIHKCTREAITALDKNWDL